MGRPSNTAERREQIVEGLLDVMAERGYDGASIQAIAGAAELTPGLVHYHFKSKQQILIALAHKLVAGLLARFDERAGQAETPWNRLLAFIDVHVALGCDADPRAVACWVMLGAEALRKDEIRTVYQQAIEGELELLQELVSAVLVSERRATDNTATIAAGLLSAIQGAYQLAVVTGVTPHGFAAPAIHRMARGLIQAEKMR